MYVLHLVDAIHSYHYLDLNLSYYCLYFHLRYAEACLRYDHWCQFVLIQFHKEVRDSIHYL